MTPPPNVQATVLAVKAADIAQVLHNCAFAERFYHVVENGPRGWCKVSRAEVYAAIETLRAWAPVMLACAAERAARAAQKSAEGRRAQERADAAWARAQRAREAAIDAWLKGTE